MIERRQIFGRQEWLAWRQSYLTASDVGSAFGVDDFKSPLRLWAEKMGRAPPIVETGAMRRGRLFETAAIEYLQELHPGWVIERPAAFFTDDHNRLACTPDAFATADGAFLNVQIKTISLPAFERWNGVPPLKYALQVTAENLLVDAGGGLLVVLVVSHFDAFIEVFDVPRHPAAEAAIVGIARDFWASVDAGVPPAADYARDASTLAALFPPSKDVPTPLDWSTDNRIGELLTRRDEWKAEVKEATEAIDAIDAEIVEKLQGAELAITPGWKITRKMQHRDERLVKASDYPVMKITRLKEDAA